MNRLKRIDLVTVLLLATSTVFSACSSSDPPAPAEPIAGTGGSRTGGRPGNSSAEIPVPAPAEPVAQLRRPVRAGR